MDFGRIVKVIKRKLRQYPLFYPHKDDKAIRWAIIGLGNMAEVFASALDDNKDSKIVAVASRSKDKATTFAKKHGHAKAYGSYDEMLNDSSLQLDIVYIATPAKYHAIHIRQCLEAGRNVLCEKPITANAYELMSLIELANDKSLFLMEGMWMKCLPTFQKAKHWLEEGIIGDLELIKVDFYKRELINPKLTIFNAEEGGGVLHDFGIYALTFVTSFLGGIPDVLRKDVRKSLFKIDADWQIFAERNGVKAFVSLSSNYRGASKAALIGTKGVIEFDAQFNRTSRIVQYDEYGIKQEEFEAKYNNEGFEYEIQEVKECIRAHNRQSDIVSLADSIITMEVMDRLSKE